MPIQIATDQMVFYEYNPDYLQKTKKYITNTKVLASMFPRVMPKVGIKYLNLKINAILHDSLQIEDANKFSRSNVLENTGLKDIEQNSSQYHDNIFYEEEFGRFFIETISPSIPDDSHIEIIMPPIDPPIDDVPF
jgi:hypothetical protein